MGKKRPQSGGEPAKASRTSPSPSPRSAPQLSPRTSPAKAASADPYLLEEAAYLEKDTRWRNKQRTLVLSSHGTTSQFRHLMEDIRRLLPHAKHESKFEKSNTFRELAEICELKSCNNCVYFEARKKKDLYLWVARLPSGPSVKFQVFNIHTLGEIRYSGNCLQGSRPMVTFDKSFDEVPYLTVLKEVFMQSFGTPRNHPKCKPFVDHVVSFFYSDDKVHFRHYQITPTVGAQLNDPEKQSLVEIGPRFCLEPIKMLDGAFSGECIYENPTYMTPTALRVAAKRVLGSKYSERVVAKQGREQWKEANQLEEDELMDVFK